MKLKTIKKRIVIYLVNHVLAGTRFFPAKRSLLRSIGYEIGENTKIVGPIHNTGTLRIGANCWIGCNLTVHVFHAAALKQVPSCEFYPMEAVKTNVAGSDNVISACVTNHVKKAIFLSTDKAAYPINAMGMTKAVMEKNVIARSRQMLPGDPVLCLTRYGNVMASRGSVIPLFCDQIDEGKPLTITNPNMTRFMMTLSDAVDLVLYAFEHGEQGDLFVQKAPAATIETLAQAVLELKHSNLGTTIIGTRHGEKLFEVLVTAEEMMRAEELPGFFRIPADNRDLNYDNYFSKGNPEFGKIEQYTSHNTHRLNVEEMKQLLLKLKLFGGTC